MLEVQELLKELEPENHIYFFGKDGLTKRIIEETTKIGVLKLKFALRERGYDENKVLVVYGPGSAITNSPRERRAGFEDGIRLLVKECLWPYIKPACGYFIGHIPYSRLDLTKLRKKYKQLRKTGFLVDGYRVYPGTDKPHRNSNHFLEIWKLEKSSVDEFQPGYYIAIHTEFDFNEMMWQECKDMFAQRIETPLGDVELIEGSDARKFLREMEKIDELSKKKRAILASLLIDNNVEEKFNLNHKKYFILGNWYGVDASNYFSIENDNSNIVPVCFDEKSPVYLIKGKWNIKRDVWPTGYEERAERLDLAKDIERINIMMHGGAETKDDLPFKEVELDLAEKQLILDEVKVIKDPSLELERRFRKPEEVLPYIEKFELGEVVGIMKNVFTLSEKLFEK